MQDEKPLSEKWFLLIFICWALFLSFEFWGFGLASYVKIPDSADANLAARLALPQNIKNHENGLWNADLLAGVDRVSQADTLGVFDALFLILPGWLAYGLFLFLQRFIAGYFTFKVLHKQLSVSVPLALFPALFYSLYSQNQINLQFEGFTLYDGLGLPAIPLILFVLGNLASKGKGVRSREFVVAFLLGLLFANVSTFVYTIFFFPLLALWLVFMFPRNGKSAVLILCIFVLGWLSLEIFEIVATYSFASVSQRTLRESCTGVAVTTFSSMTRFLPYYVLKADNIPALMAGFLGIATWRKNLMYRQGLVGFGLLILYVGASFYLPGWICSPNNPVGIIKGFNYSRFFFYFPFLISITAGVGLQNVTDFLRGKFAFGNRLGGLFTPVLSTLLIAFTIYLGLTVKKITLQARLVGSNYANIFMNPYLEFLAEKIHDSGEHYRAVMLNQEDSAFLSSPGFLWPYGINTLDGYTGIYSLRFSEYWSLVIRPMMDIYPQCRYGLKFLKGNSRVILSPACDVGHVIDISAVSNLFDLDLLSLSGVRYFVSTTELSNPSLVQIDASAISCQRRIPGCTRYFLYEDKEAFPFVFSVSGVIERPEQGKILNNLSQADLSDLRSQVYVFGDDVTNLALNHLGDSAANLVLNYYSSDFVSVGFSSKDAKIVVFNWNYSKDWRVWIDEKEVKVFPVDHILLGVYVPEGDHRIDINYLPKYSVSYLANKFGLKKLFFEK